MTAKPTPPPAHTPGPWRVDQELGFIQVLHGSPQEFGTVRIAIVDDLAGWHGDVPRTTNKEGEANARLIAAAPDLLEALEQMISECGASNAKPPRVLWNNLNALDKAGAAISKATGNET